MFRLGFTLTNNSGQQRIGSGIALAIALVSILSCAGAAVAIQDTATTPNDAATQPQDKDNDSVYVRITTNKGDIILELNKAKAPKSVANFMSYVEEEYFDGTIFHRIIEQFMIQGGGFTSDMKKKPTKPGVENEWQNGLKNDRGTISMARIGGQPNSGTSQFFINVVDNPMLDRAQADGAAYAVFGSVVAGMDVVDAIRSVPVQVSPLNRREISYPTEPIVIEMLREMTADDAREAIEAAAAKSAPKPSEEKQPSTTPGVGD